jgi:hypothetical protein
MADDLDALLVDQQGQVIDARRALFDGPNQLDTVETEAEGPGVSGWWLRVWLLPARLVRLGRSRHAAWSSIS